MVSVHCFLGVYHFAGSFITVAIVFGGEQKGVIIMSIHMSYHKAYVQRVV